MQSLSVSLRSISVQSILNISFCFLKLVLRFHLYPLVPESSSTVRGQREDFAWQIPTGRASQPWGLLLCTGSVLAAQFYLRDS